MYDLNSTMSAALGPETQAPTLEPLFGAAHQLSYASERFHWERTEGGRGGRGERGESRVRSVNDRMMLAERAFLDPMGLGANATWYKHLVSSYNVDTVHAALCDSYHGLHWTAERYTLQAVLRMQYCVHARRSHSASLL